MEDVADLEGRIQAAGKARGDNQGEFFSTKFLSYRALGSAGPDAGE
jgi:hypothetical protein